MLAKLREQMNVWVIVFSVLFALGLLCVFIFTTLISRPASTSTLISTPLYTIVSAPTKTVTVDPSIVETQTAQNSEYSSLPGEIGIGKVVQIVGTEGAGLRLRQQPGTGGVVQFLGDEMELFEVTEGPSEADGYVWWYLESPYDTARSGWAAADYLELIEEN